jgi:membrane fusion protein
MPSTGQLFREEAIEFQRNRRQWGDVALLQPLSTKVLSWFVALLTAGVVTFLVIGEYARKETVVGYLTPVSGTSKIFVPQQGIIREIHVVQGQKVEQGQSLLTVETSRSRQMDEMSMPPCSTRCSPRRSISISKFRRNRSGEIPSGIG